MFMNPLIFLLFAFSLGWSLQISIEREYIFLFWLPIPLTLALLFLLNRSRKWYWVSFVLIALAIGYRSFEQHLYISGPLYFIAFLTLSFLVHGIRRQLDRDIALNVTIREKSARSLAIMEERFEKEDKKIQDLDGKTENIIHLFELAKDFNTCLSFSDLLTAIRDTVLSSISCRRLRLLILPSTLSDQCRGFQIDSREIVPWVENRAISEEEMSLLAVLGEVQKLDTAGELSLPVFLQDRLSDSTYPLWIFPLKIEYSTIAFLILEEAQEKDFYRCQIVAGQLALQIQKTLLYEKVHALSLFDGLTQVYVKRHMEERLEEEMRRSHLHGMKLSVLMADVDHFKSINDQYGHLVGDRILKEIADTIRDQIRTVDLVGRFGGEEFILIFPETDTQGSLATAERIRSAVAKKKIKVYDEEIRVTLSIGMATFPDCLSEKGKGPFDLVWTQAVVELADIALYQAKEDGRNQVKGFDRP